MTTTLKALGYARLDEIIAEHGDDWLHGQIVTRVADGDDPKSIARSFGVPYICIRKWMEENCAEDIALALRARADILEHQATEAVDDAMPDSVQVARLQADYYLKLAARFDRKKYGDKDVQEQGVGGMVLPVFQISFVSSPQVVKDVVVIEQEMVINEGD